MATKFRRQQCDNRSRNRSAVTTSQGTPAATKMEKVKTEDATHRALQKKVTLRHLYIGPTELILDF
jgi:hypothetical protein